MKKRKLFLALALFAMTQTWAQTEWSNATALPSESGSYKLTTDVTLSETWEAPAGETTLDLNDHIVRRTFANDDEIGTVIFIEEGNTLTIEDNASAKTTRYWEIGTYKEWTNPQTTGSGELKTVGGCITGGRGDQFTTITAGEIVKGILKRPLPETITGNVFAGGIASFGTLNLIGGNVVGNRILQAPNGDLTGGGILQGSRGNLIIGENAAVLGNALYAAGSPRDDGDMVGLIGAGVNVQGSANCVNNGRVEYNHAEDFLDVDTRYYQGVGVGLFTEGTTFTNNGSVSYNTAYTSNSNITNFNGGGGVYVKGGCSFVNNGVIANNSLKNNVSFKGGGVMSTGFFTNNGIITGNEAGQGGGVNLNNGGTFINTGTISNNTAYRTAGGLLVTTRATSVLLKAGTRITDNLAYVGADQGGMSMTNAGTGGGIITQVPLTIESDNGTVEISGNKAEVSGAGVYLYNTELILKGEASGKLILTGNTLADGTTASNVTLYGKNAKININDANSLKNDATVIGVNIRKTATDATFTPASGVVTTGYGKHSTEVLERFQLDEPLYEGTLLDIYKNSDNEVEIGLKVNDTGSNDAGLSAYDGKTVGVKLSRTLIGDGYYNTICLPFDVDNATLKKRFGNDVELKQMDKSVAGSNAIDMTMVFTSASEIEAGKPYLIKVSEDVVDPTFTDVTIKNTLKPKETELCTFVPVFNQTRLENDNKKILFLGANNTLTWPSTEKYTADFRGLRSYFELKNEAGANIGSAKTFRLVFDDETTVIENVNVNANDNGILYNLQGQRVNKAVNGIYIKNGKKFVK